jgi:hypothetical protein
VVDLIIGVDCATQAKKVGLARAIRHGDVFRVVEATACRGLQTPLEILESWMDGNQRALIALDAPLGWPSALSRALSSHSAGKAIRVPPNVLFRRVTDRLVAERTGKTPLDVGADRIARTAHSALLFLDELRRGTGESIPLAWERISPNRVTAIEVYPAATLLMHGLSWRGYKARGGTKERKAIIEVVGRCLDCTPLLEMEAIGVDAFDAVVCVLAGADFLEGNAEGPDDVDVAKREGWIWVRSRNAL